MRPLPALLADLERVQRVEDERDRRVRAAFQERTGHPRGVAVLGADAGAWRELESLHPRDDAAADRLVAEAVGTYLEADDGDRAALRDVFDRGGYLRWRVGWVGGDARRAIERAGAGDAVEAGCRRALAAATLGAAGDYRDTIVTLDGLYMATLLAGVDPAPLFREAEAAARSGDGAATPASQLIAIYLDPDRAAALRHSAERRRGAVETGR